MRKAIQTPESLDPAIRTLDDLIEAIRTSQFVVVLHNGTIDSKVGIEAGIAVLADRPILVFNLTPRPLPRKLLMVAEIAIEVPNYKTLPKEIFQAVMTAGIQQMTAFCELRERAGDTAPQS